MTLNSVKHPLATVNTETVVEKDPLLFLIHTCMQFFFECIFLAESSKLFKFPLSFDGKVAVI